MDNWTFLIAGCGNGGCNGGGGQAEEPSFGGIQPRKGEKCFVKNHENSEKEIC